MKENKEIEELRESINLLDKEIIEGLDKRMDIVKRIGEIKKENNLPLEDLSREEKVLEKTDSAKNKENLREIYKKIFEESKKIQKLEK